MKGIKLVDVDLSEARTETMLVQISTIQKKKESIQSESKALTTDSTG